MDTIKNYIVKETVIRHNHKKFMPGSVIELCSADAERLKDYVELTDSPMTIEEEKIDDVEEEKIENIKIEKTKKGVKV